VNVLSDPGFTPYLLLQEVCIFRLFEATSSLQSLYVHIHEVSFVVTENNTILTSNPPCNSYWLMWLSVSNTEANALLECNSWHSNEKPSWQHYFCDSYGFLKFAMAMWKGWSSEPSWLGEWRLVMSPDVIYLGRMQTLFAIETSLPTPRLELMLFQLSSNSSRSGPGYDVFLASSSFEIWYLTPSQWPGEAQLACIAQSPDAAYSLEP